MSGPGPVDPVGIPVFTGDLALLDTKVTALSGHGTAIATAAGDVHRSFGGLSAFYKAPEAEQLFATTAPVAATGLSLSSDLCVIAGALSTYSDDAFPLVEKLKELKRDAVAFRVEVDGDDKWREDGDLVEENNQRRNEIAEVWAAFQEVERACHAKIVALVGGTALKTGDGSGKQGTYGYDAETLKQAKSLPWGEAVEESTPWWQVWEHAYDFGKGFLVDGVWGTIKGLGTLVGVEGGDAAGEAWTGLAKLATGLSPVAQLVLHALPGDKYSAWIQDSRKAVRETGKALVAWDQWSSNPSRAAGAVTFNVLTTVFTGGSGGAAAGAGKAGLAAKALSLTTKTARAVDPMTYVFKGASTGLTRIGDVMAGLKGLGHVEFPPLPDHVITFPEGTLRLPDNTLHLPEGAAVPEGATTLPNGTVKLPEDAVALPEGTVRSPFDEGAPYLDRDGNLYNEDGTLAQRANQARQEPHPHAQTPDHVREPALTGATTHAGNDATHLSNDIGDLGRPGGDVPGGGAGNHLPDNSPSRTPGGGTGHSTLSNHLGDGAPNGRSDGNGSTDHTSTPGMDLADGHDLPARGNSGRDGAGSDGMGGSAIDDFGNSDGWEKSHDYSGPLERGGNTESQIRDQLRRSDVKPADLERVLTNLANNRAGREIADIIASGKFRGLVGYDSVVSSLSRSADVSGGIEQLRLGSRLHASGVSDISFEIKQAGHEIKPGVFTEMKTDLDVMARDASGKVHGWQLKDMTGPDSPADPSKIVGKIFKNIKQLTDSHADVQTFVVETKALKHEIATQIERLQRGYEGKKVQFVIRSPDGNTFVPPGGKFTPEGMP
ncbi:hypothetical protein ACFC5Z_01230 [Streptomyces sp. NPDC056004]|uniref:hypothetical protein n=1 Tax=Streptomyces sp. NPDC056004 TaxID=3345677 RepID=UPI0035D75F41